MPPLSLYGLICPPVSPLLQHSSQDPWSFPFLAEPPLRNGQLPESHGLWAGSQFKTVFYPSPLSVLPHVPLHFSLNGSVLHTTQ